MLVRPGTDLGQDFSDMAYIFFVFFILLISLLFFLIIYVTNLCVMLLLHHMLVLYPLSGASYCTGYLFILIYTIVKLNVLKILFNV